DHDRFVLRPLRDRLVLDASARLRRLLVPDGLRSLLRRRLVVNLLHLRRREDLVELDVGLDLQRLAELLDRLVPLLEAEERDDAEVDVSARGDRMLLEAGLHALVERGPEQLSRPLEVQVLVLVDPLLVELGDLLYSGRIL